MERQDLIDKTILFEAGVDGYANYRIPGIVTTQRGVVIASVEARGGSGGDWDDSDLFIRRSFDGGRTWEHRQLIASNRDLGPGPVSNCVVIADSQDGRLHLLYCHFYSRVFYIRSDDHGASFSSPVEITSTFDQFRPEYPWRVMATGPGHGLQLRNGRMIVPIWMSDGSGSEFGSGALGHRPSVVSLVYSDDHGLTWHRGEIFCRHGQGSIANPSETVMAELSDGRVMANIRSESDEHRRLTSISPDGISKWSEPVFEEQLIEPVCIASMLRYRWPEEGSPGMVLFANPASLEDKYGYWHPARDRERLTIRVSLDDCATWPHSMVIEEGPSGYSDLALAPDGSVLCLYECGVPGKWESERRIVHARVSASGVS